MFAAEGAFGAVGAQRGQAEQGIQVETAQGPAVGAQAQILFFQQVVAAPAEHNKNQGGHNGERGAARLQPDHTQGGQQQLEKRPQESEAQDRQGAQGAQVVGAHGHIGGQAAVEVPVAQARDFLEEEDAQAGFQFPPDALHPGGKGQLDQENGQQKGEQRRQRAQALVQGR